MRSADPVREATRASDFLLTVELSLGDVTIVSHTGRAAELLDFEANQIAVTLKTPAWFDEYLAWSLGRVPKTALQDPKAPPRLGPRFDFWAKPW